MIARRFTLRALFGLVTAFAVCTFCLSRFERQWWTGKDKKELTEFVQNRLATSSDVRIAWVDDTKRVPINTDRLCPKLMAQKFVLLSDVRNKVMSTNCYFHVTITNGEWPLSFSVCGDEVIFGEDEWHDCARVDPAFSCLLHAWWTSVDDTATLPPWDR